MKDLHDIELLAAVGVGRPRRPGKMNRGNPNPPAGMSMQEDDLAISARSCWMLRKGNEKAGLGIRGIVTSRHSVRTTKGELPVVRFRMYVGNSTRTAVMHFDRETFLKYYEPKDW
jgi:hypothetical protein